MRWAVLPGVDAEGLLIEPKDKPKAIAVAIPHADQLPEELAGLTKGDDFGLRLARHGCRVLIPTLIDRKDDLSGNAKLKRQTNIPHREFIHRMAYEMGRTLIGYEVQKVLAAVDWFKAQDAKLKIGVIGYGEGGMIALYAGALDERIASRSGSGLLRPAREAGRGADRPQRVGLAHRVRRRGTRRAMISPRGSSIRGHRPGSRRSGPGRCRASGAAGPHPGRLRRRCSTGDIVEEHRYRSFFDPKLKKDGMIEGGGFRRSLQARR